MIQLSEKHQARIDQMVADGEFDKPEEALEWLELEIDILLGARGKEPAHHTPEFLASLDAGIKEADAGGGKVYANAREAQADLWPTSRNEA